MGCHSTAEQLQAAAVADHVEPCCPTAQAKMRDSICRVPLSSCRLPHWLSRHSCVGMTQPT